MMVSGSHGQNRQVLIICGNTLWHAVYLHEPRYLELRDQLADHCPVLTNARITEWHVPMRLAIPWFPDAIMGESNSFRFWA